MNKIQMGFIKKQVKDTYESVSFVSPYVQKDKTACCNVKTVSWYMYSHVMSVVTQSDPVSLRMIQTCIFTCFEILSTKTKCSIEEECRSQLWAS